MCSNLNLHLYHKQWFYQPNQMNEVEFSPHFSWKSDIDAKIKNKKFNPKENMNF